MTPTLSQEGHSGGFAERDALGEVEREASVGVDVRVKQRGEGSSVGLGHASNQPSSPRTSWIITVFT